MEKTISITKSDTSKKIAIFSTLVAVAVVVPAILHYQLVTGTIVNATLFIATAFFSPVVVVLVGLLPSIVAFASGLLPAPLAPIIPFIMISNSILVLSFYYLRKKNFGVGILVASALKFLFLFSTSTLVMTFLVKEELAKQVALMMNWPQLFTALAGGVVAYFLLKALKKT